MAVRQIFDSTASVVLVGEKVDTATVGSVLRKSRRCRHQRSWLWPKQIWHIKQCSHGLSQGRKLGLAVTLFTILQQFTSNVSSLIVSCILCWGCLQTKAAVALVRVLLFTQSDVAEDSEQTFTRRHWTFDRDILQKKATWATSSRKSRATLLLVATTFEKSGSRYLGRWNREVWAYEAAHLSGALKQRTES